MPPTINDNKCNKFFVDLFRNLWQILNCDCYLRKNYTSPPSNSKIKILITNCCLESLLLNMRFLNEFFEEQNKKKDDLRANDFITPEEYQELKNKIECNILNKNERREINKTIMHPTLELMDYETDWLAKNFKTRIFLCFRQFLKYQKPRALIIENSDELKNEDFKEVFQELKIDINSLSCPDHTHKNS